jgi:transposase
MDKKMTKRYALTDYQWEKIKHLLPGRIETVGVTTKDNRLFVEAVIYRYRAGIPWRDLPERFVETRCIVSLHVGQKKR